MNAKHFVLVHGACHGAWVWYKVIPLLAARGHNVTVTDLVASGINTDNSIENVVSADEYSKPLLDIMELIPKGEKVILVGESYGGINITIAADKYPKKIAVAVYVNAFMPDTANKPSYVTDTFMRMNQNRDWMDTMFSNDTGTVKWGPRFMNATMFQKSPEAGELATLLTRTGSWFQTDLSSRQNFTSDGYGSVKRVYVMGDDDKFLRGNFHDFQKTNFPPTEDYTIAGGDHKLMFSRTEALVEYLLNIAEKYA